MYDIATSLRLPENSETLLPKILDSVHIVGQPGTQAFYVDHALALVLEKGCDLYESGAAAQADIPACYDCSRVLVIAHS